MLLLKLTILKYMSRTLVCHFQLMLSLKLSGLSKFKKNTDYWGAKEGEFFQHGSMRDLVKMSGLPGEAADIPLVGMN